MNYRKFRDVKVKTGMYANKRLAIQIISKDGELISIATINLPDEINQDFHEVAINPYDGNDKIEDFFKEIGIINSEPNRIVTLDNGEYPIYAINFKKLLKYDESVQKYIDMLSEHKHEVKCKRCGKRPEELKEYLVNAEDEGMTATQYVIENESTYNEDIGEFLCTKCYVEKMMEDK